jgi:hypothetical protein
MGPKSRFSQSRYLTPCPPEPLDGDRGTNPANQDPRCVFLEIFRFFYTSTTEILLLISDPAEFFRKFYRLYIVAERLTSEKLRPTIEIY